MVETGFSYGVQQKGSLRPSSFREGLVWACFLIHVGRSLAVRKELPDEYGSALGQLYRFAEQQLYVAPPNATVPTPTALRFNFGRDLYKLEKCERKNVANCLYYGNSSNGLPAQLQGILWQNGIDFDEVAIPTAGTWDPFTRVLSLEPSLERRWASRGTDARLAPSGNYWLPSGASHMNFLVALGAGISIYYNEDITFGQIYGRNNFWGINLPAAPTWIFDWTMTQTADKSWERVSRSFGVPEPDGDYLLLPIVTGEGKPGKYFDDWVKARDGKPIYYVAEKVCC